MIAKINSKPGRVLNYYSADKIECHIVGEGVGFFKANDIVVWCGNKKSGSFTPLSEIVELWHKSNWGPEFSRGYMDRGSRTDMYHRALCEYSIVDKDITLHLVPYGSYAGFTEPELGANNMIVRGPVP